jgi:uncharacterized protein
MIRRIAVIGGGISGNLAARLLSDDFQVDLLEAAGHLGGHAQTVDVELEGKHFPVDVGFMVYNERTYPNFTRMLRWLNVGSRDTDMSFSVRCARTRLEYQGSSLNGLFAQRRNLLRPRFHQMLADILRFNRLGRRWVAERADGSVEDMLGDERTVGQFLAEQRFGRLFIEQYLTPMAAAIWSCHPGKMLDFPLSFLLRFFENHGLMQLRRRPQWKTIVGGSRSYVDALMNPFRGRIRHHSRVARICRMVDGVRVETAAGELLTYDAVVLATHADQSLRMLMDADRLERRILGAFPYEANAAVLHTDRRMLPRRRRAWASWNYHIPKQTDAPATVTYDLSRLQGVDSPQPILLTLNAAEAGIDESRVIRRFQFQHPVYGLGSLDAQLQWSRISGRGGVYYCGAYWGYGFHEDGVNSALAVVDQLGEVRVPGEGRVPCRAVSTAGRFSIAGSRR